MRLLITRAAAEGVRTAAALQQQGHTTLLAPLLRIETLAPDFGAGPWDGVIMTSANAARALRDHPRRDELLPLKLFAVGRTTAQAAHACGFRDVVSADGDVSDLLNLLTRSPLRTGRLLYLAGADRTVDLSAALAPAGTQVDTVVIYRAVAETRLPDEVESAFAARRDRRRVALFAAHRRGLRYRSRGGRSDGARPAPVLSVRRGGKALASRRRPRFEGSGAPR